MAESPDLTTSTQDDSQQPGNAADESCTDLLKSQQQYYDKVHTIKEPVDSQPKLVVAGDLRDYQLGGVRFLLSLHNNGVNGILADEMVRLY